jgi:superfamily II DNA or RNA helicase
LGEGFDDARLDTLFLTLPISWRGTLSQYAGRLHREYHQKKEVIIYDYLDENVPTLLRMYKKRRRGYYALGYDVEGYQSSQTQGESPKDMSKLPLDFKDGFKESSIFGKPDIGKKRI